MRNKEWLEKPLRSIRYVAVGFVRDGLVADAKSDLAEQHPLAANQGIH